jgi:hypothetical protein
MDISSLSSSQSATAGTNAASASAASLSQFKAEQGSQLLSLLPAPASSPGLGLNLDIYAAIGSQAHGLLAGGRTAMEIANISLGIDMKTANPAAGTDGSSNTSSADTSGTTSGGNAAGADGGSSTATANGSSGSASSGHGNSQLDAILKADGFVAPEADPYVVRTDFFSQAAPVAPPTATPTYTNSSLSNPGLGGLLNSLG